MIDQKMLTRQWDIIPQSCLDTEITVIGAGAVGSWTALALAKMGFERLRVIDFDTIEIENMAGQAYGVDAIGKPKVVALQEMIERLTTIRIEAINDKYVSAVYPGIVVTAVDQMFVRRAVWEAHKEVATQTKMIVDPRMASQVASLFLMHPMNPDDIRDYEHVLFSDEDAHHEPCTAKSTTFCALVIAGFVAKAVKDVAVGGSYARTANMNLKNNFYQAWTKGGHDAAKEAHAEGAVRSEG